MQLNRPESRRNVLVVSLCVLALTPATASATNPHLSRMFQSPSLEWLVELRPFLSAAVTVQRRNGTGRVTLTLAALDPAAAVRWRNVLSTAGTHWYRHVMGFFAPGEGTLILRLDNGDLVGLDLRTARRVAPLPATLARDAALRFAALAATWMASKNPLERETGAVVAGQARLASAVPLLRRLLRDPDYVTVIPADGRAYREYYVRKAAARALLVLGVKTTEGVEIEVPLRNDPLQSP